MKKVIREFHRKISEIQIPVCCDRDDPEEGCFQLFQIVNVDQTPLPFSFTDGPTYKTTITSTVWVKAGSFAVDKHQCTLQLTLFDDGENRVNKASSHC